MNGTALVLAAHGSRHEPSVNAQVRAYADAVASRGLFDEVAVAFHQGEPPFHSVLDELTAQEVVVVPLMTSEGYYSDVVLPRELAKSHRGAVAMEGQSIIPPRGVSCPSEAKECSHGWSAAQPVAGSSSSLLRSGGGGGTRPPASSRREARPSSAPSGRESRTASDPRVPLGGLRPPDAPPVATVHGPSGADSLIPQAHHPREGGPVDPAETSASKNAALAIQAFPYSTLRITKPVGTHPAILDLVASRVAALVTAYDSCAQETSVAIVGHGTPRHPRSRNATVDLAARLEDRGDYAEVLPAFLDEHPLVESIVERASRENIIVVLFLIGAGPHATRDMPRRIGMNTVDVASLPLSGRVGGRRVICDAPVGTDPGIVDIIIQLSRPPRFASSGREATRGSQVFPEPRASARGLG